MTRLRQSVDRVITVLNAGELAADDTVRELLELTTVRRRMDQLRDLGLLYYDLELDMPSFGFRSSAWLWLSVPPAHLADVGSALAKFPEVAYVAATTGPANLAACAVCRDEESLYEFLTLKVGALPGVERVETTPIIRTVKQASPVMASRP